MAVWCGLSKSSVILFGQACAGSYNAPNQWNSVSPSHVCGTFYSVWISAAKQHLQLHHCCMVLQKHDTPKHKLTLKCACSTTNTSDQHKTKWTMFWSFLFFSNGNDVCVCIWSRHITSDPLWSLETHVEKHSNTRRAVHLWSAHPTRMLMSGLNSAENSLVQAPYNPLQTNRQTSKINGSSVAEKKTA